MALMGLGGSTALVKTVLTASETQHRISSLEISRTDQDERLDAHDRVLAMLEANSAMGVRDRREMLDSLNRIEARIR